MDAKHILRIGLTGGIASGKTSVSDMFAALGVSVVDTDVIARQIVAPGQSALAEISAAFGADVLDNEGNLDRSALRKLVFADEASRQQLQAITHPRIRKETFAQVEKATTAYVLIVVPLLVESDFKQFVDRILVVDCPEAVQIERLMQRDGGDEQSAKQILAAQASRQTRLAAANDIISNTGDLALLEQQVQRLHGYYLQLAESRAS